MALGDLMEIFFNIPPYLGFSAYTCFEKIAKKNTATADISKDTQNRFMNLSFFMVNTSVKY